MKEHLVLSILWIVYFAIHSLLATNSVKEKLSFLKRYYRLFYNIVSVTGLFAILLYSAIVPADWIFPKTTFSKFIGLMLATYGVFIIRHAFKSYNMKDFLGLQQLEENYKTEKFKKDGVLAYVRLPLYLGTILIVAGFFVYSPNTANLITAVLSILYLFVGIWLEEKKLLAMYGDEYKKYQKNTPMLIPKKIKLF